MAMTKRELIITWVWTIGGGTVVIAWGSVVYLLVKRWLIGAF